MKRSTVLVLGYLFLGILWIYFSDRLLGVLVLPEAYLAWQTAKGFIFIFVTGGLLFWERSGCENDFARIKSNLAASQETAKLGNFVYNISGRRYWSEMMFRLCGIKRSRKPLAVDELTNFFYEHDRTEIAAKVSQSWKDGLGFEGEYRFLPRDKEAIWIRLKVKAVTDKEGRVLSLSGVMQDVTERKQHLLELENMASFLTLSPIPIFEVDLTGRVTYCSLACHNSSLHKVEEGGGSLPADFSEIANNFLSGRINGAETREVTVGGKKFLETICFVPDRKMIRIYAQEGT